MFVECFAGIKAGRLALEDVPVQVVCDLSSEIDPFALAVQNKNWPGSILLGNISEISEQQLCSALCPFGERWI